jgi:hypothetical protein
MKRTPSVNQKNRCRICGKEFSHAWNHPEQSVCFAKECRCRANTERNRVYLKRKKQRQLGRADFSEKDRRIYLRQNAMELLAGKEVNPLAFVHPGQQYTLNMLADLLFRLELAVDGLICILNSRMDTQPFSRAECYEYGKALFRSSAPSEKE